MNDHLSGNTFGTRNAGNVVCHTYGFSYNTPGIGSGILVDTIRASADQPVQVEVQAQVVTGFNAGTTNVVTAGTTAAANEWLGTIDVVESTPGYYPSNNIVAKFRLTANTPIYVKYTQTGTAATTGQGVLIVREYQENTKAIA